MAKVVKKGKGRSVRTANFMDGASVLGEKQIGFFSRKAFVCIVISTVIVSSVLYWSMSGKRSVEAATYYFIQSVFSGGADTENFPHHPDSQSNWDKYYAKDDNVVAGDDISLYSTTSDWTETSDTDFADGTMGGMAVSGTGDSANLITSSFVGPDANSYSYRRPLSIQNNAAQDLTAYQIKISLDTASLIAQGKLQGDCDDIRFADSLNANIPYWIESGCNTNSSIIWIKTDLSASGSKAVYVYYGNASVGSGQDGSSVFDFFDDFSGSSLDTSKWDTVGTGTTTLSGGIMTTGSGNTSPYTVKSKATFGNNYAVRSRLKSGHIGASYTELAGFSSDAGYGAQAIYANVSSSYQTKYYSRDASSNATSAILGWTANTYAVQDIIRNSTVSNIFKVNDGSQVAMSTYVYAGTDSKAVFTTVNSGSSIASDWILVRKYISTEPTYAWGSDAVDPYISSAHLFSPTVVYSALSFSKAAESLAFPDAFSQWGFRRAYSVTNNVSTSYAGYQVKLALDTAALIAEGKMQGDCDDMRFTEADGSAIPYWLESGCNTSSTIVWLKTDLAASSAKNVYMYYGNGTTVSASDGEAVFDFFDGFSGSSLDTANKWDVSGTGTNTVSGGIMTTSGTSAYIIKSKTVFGTGYAIRSRLKSAHFNVTTYSEYFSFQNDSSNGIAALYSNTSSGYQGKYFTQNSTYSATSILGWSADTYAVQDIIRAASSGIFLVNDASQVTLTSPYYTGADCSVRFRTSSAVGASISADWVLVRKYAATEPSVSSGAEESQYGIRFQLRSADTLDALSSATWYGPTGTSDYYMISGASINPVHNGQQFFQYKAVYSSASAVLYDITVDMSAVDTLTSSPYDIGDVSAVLSNLTWSQTLPEGATVRFQLRATVDASGLPDAGSWTDWVGPDGTGSSFFSNPAGGVAIPAVLKTGGRQWVQYKLYLSGSGQSPVVDDINLEYTINGQPQVTVISAAQGDDGKVSVAYMVSDPDPDDAHTVYAAVFANVALNEDLTSADATAVTVNNIGNLPASGIVLIGEEMISYAGKNGNDLTGILRNVNNTTASTHALGADVYILGNTSCLTGDIGPIDGITGTPSEHSFVWDVATDVPGVYLTNTAKIKVAVNDGNGAFQLGTAESSALDVLDTKLPVVASIAFDGTASPDISLDVSDDSALEMKYAMTAELLETAQYSSYVSSLDLDLDGQTTVYFRFRDGKDNVADHALSVPAKPLHPLVQDISSDDIPAYRLFLSFSPIAEPANTFQNYVIYASESGADGTFGSVATFDDRTANYYLDDSLAQDQKRYYRIAATDAAGNIGEPSDTVYGTANGYEDAGEGINGGGTAPVISHDPATQISDVADDGAVITFTTDVNSDSEILYSTDTSYAKSQGVPTFVAAGNTHSVTLSGLAENTKYYYKIVSRDALGSAGSLENSAAQFFTTTTDMTAPEIRDLAVSTTENSCAFSFATTKPSLIRIDYGTDDSYGQYVTGDNLNIDHRFNLSGLSADTVYHYKITATDDTLSHNSTNTGDLSLTTTTLPVIVFDAGSGIADVTSSGATISFTTNKSSNSLIDYSQTAGVFTSTQGQYQDNLAIHSVTLTGLEPATTYYLRLRSEDGDGLEASDDNGGTGYSFTTLAGEDRTAPIVSGVILGVPASNTITVSWTTDKPASSLVDFGSDLSYGRTQGNSSEAVTAHSVTLTGLSASTGYLLRVKSIDASGNIGSDDNAGAGYAFNTAAVIDPEDSVAPIVSFDPISGIASLDSSSVAISWTTDEEADATVGYGTDDSFAQEYGLVEYALTHTITLSNLAPDTTYYFRLKSQDASGNMAVDDNSGQGYSFTTLSGPDVTAPVISDVQVSSTSGDGATIEWITNENASSLVEYGTQAGDFSSIAGNYGAMVSEHRVSVGGLSALTTFYFRVRSEDAGQNMSTDEGGDSPYSFATLAEEDDAPVCSSGGGSSRDTTPPSVSGIRVLDVSEENAKVTWTSNEAGYSLVEYGEDSDYGNVFGSGISFSKDHLVSLPYLQAGKVYHYRVLCADADGNLSRSSDFTFTTLRAEEIQTDAKQQVQEKIRELSDSGYSESEIRDIIAASASPLRITSEIPRISDITNSSANVSWKTDRKANSVVRFRVKGRTLEKESGDFNGLFLEHQVALAGLDAGVSYEYQVQSSDALGNTSRSEWYGFTTSITPSVYDVVVSSINLSSAVIEWKTNVAASGQLQYGVSINYGSTFRGNENDKSTVHIAKLQNLESGKKYHYRIQGLDIGGNSLASDDYTFTTFTIPRIDEYAVSSVSEREASLQWVTNVETDTNVRYIDIATNEVKTQGEDALTKVHDFKLKGLEPGRQYLVRIEGRDEYGNQAISQEVDLATLTDVNPPEFGRVSVETTISSGKSGQVRAIISYVTNELSTTQVFYKQGAGEGEYSQSTSFDENLTTNHVVVITDFKPASVYEFRIEAKDSFGNTGHSKDFTVLVPEEKKSVIQMITNSMENTFGWLKKIRR